MYNVQSKWYWQDSTWESAGMQETSWHVRAITCTLLMESVVAQTPQTYIDGLHAGHDCPVTSAFQHVVPK